MPNFLPKAAGLPALDALAAAQQRALAERALEGVARVPDWARRAARVWPHADWLQQVPCARAIAERMGEVDPEVDLAEDASSVSVGWNDAQLREVAAGLEREGMRVAENLVNVQQVLEDEFLQRLRQAIAVTGELGLADHPAVEAGRWMATAHALHLGRQARLALFWHGLPATHARWLAAATPLGTGWGQALALVRDLGREGHLARARAWLPVVLAAEPRCLAWPGEGGLPYPGEGLEMPQARAVAAEALWADLASEQWRCDEDLDAMVAGLEEACTPELVRVAWDRVLMQEADDNKGPRLVAPELLRARVGAIVARHRDKADAWRAGVAGAGRMGGLADGAGQPIPGRVAAAVRMLAPCGMDGLRQALRRLDGAMRPRGGYAAAVEAGVLDACLGQAGPVASRPRM